MNRRRFFTTVSAVIAATTLTRIASSESGSSPISLDQLKAGTYSGCLFGSTVPPDITRSARPRELGLPFAIQHGYSSGGFSSLDSPPSGLLLAQTLSSGSKSQTWVQDANAGKLDAQYAVMRDEIAAPTFIILWQEFNGHWESTWPGNYGGTRVFVQAWRRMALILRQNPNVIMCWSPNVYTAASTTSPIDPKDCYPGRDVVDWVAFDGYCHGSYRTFDQLFGQAIRDYGPNGVRHKHPFMVGETAVQPTLDRDRYVSSVQQSLENGAGKDAVKALLWFDGYLG
jgi:hypothetical protein